jgi:hypothetical protein
MPLVHRLSREVLFQVEMKKFRLYLTDTVFVSGVFLIAEARKKKAEGQVPLFAWK